MDLVEKVARAICRSNEWGEPEIDARVEHGWPMFVADAEAAIAAMREPTAAMVAAGDKGIDECYSTGYGTQDITPSAECVWANMINAALTRS